MAGIEAWSFILLGIFLVFSAFFSGTEASMLSVQRIRIQYLVATKTAGAARVARMVERPERLLPPILLGNNLVNTAAAALATSIAASLFSDAGTGLVVATAVVTVFLVVFGETLPKSIGARYAEQTAIIVALPLQWITWILTPFSWVLQKFSEVVARLFGAKGTRAAITEEELRALIMVGHEAGAVERIEAEMIHRVLDMADRRVSVVMTPRTAIVAVRLGTSIRNFLSIYAKTKHTRYPVYDGDVDNIVGIVSAKDILRALARGARQDEPATTLMRKPLFVPETMRIDQLMAEMRERQQSLALVTDEFGGVVGLVTLKRLVQSIVGGFSEEDDQPTLDVLDFGNGQMEMEAGIPVSEANERLKLNIPQGDYETVAGFVLEKLGRVPAAGDSFTFDGLRFEVAEMRGVRIARIRITRVPQQVT